ncbi:hypothetical protein Taro_010300, partial [Colocasia esculenta]|nr:hypothetical protein [Colocasia esculenta]
MLFGRRCLGRTSCKVPGDYPWGLKMPCVGLLLGVRRKEKEVTVASASATMSAVSRGPKYHFFRGLRERFRIGGEYGIIFAKEEESYLVKKPGCIAPSLDLLEVGFRLSLPEVVKALLNIWETYDRTMEERYAEGTPQPDLDPEAWVDAAGGPRKGRVYGFGDSLDTHPVLSSYTSSIASPAYASSFTAPPVSGVEEIRGLIREELRAHLQTQQTELQTQFGDMVQQLISAMQGVRPTQPAPQ